MSAFLVIISFSITGLYCYVHFFETQHLYKLLGEIKCIEGYN